MNIIKTDTEPNFNELEMSILFECVTSKLDKRLHSNLNSVIERRLNPIQTTLYRGITPQEIELLDDAVHSSEPFSFGRVTSFSEDYEISRDFAHFEYQTRTLVRLQATEAFCYHEAMRKLMMEVPLEFFNTASGCPSAAELRREERLEMIDTELEWMLPMNQLLSVVNTCYIDDYFVIDCVQCC
jgi:hypothetical protein